MRYAALLGWSIALALAAAPAAAHVTATGLAVVSAAEATIVYRLTVVLAELPAEAAQVLGRAAAGDRSDAERIAEAVRRHVTVRVGGAPCRPARLVIRASDVGERKAIVEQELRCAAAPGQLELEEDWSEFLGPHYRTIATVETPHGSSEHVLGEETRRILVDFGIAAPASLLGFIRLGVGHILTGYDHLLFLLALLIGASGFWRVLGIVTAFTIAHSITLSLAALGLVHAPAAVVEPLIAASIVWVAAENVLGRGTRLDRLAVTFLFGLVHGLGFADQLTELDLTGWPLVRALVGFNLGVELGQAIAICVALPALLYIGSRPHARVVYRAASLLVAAIGSYWLIERLVSA